MPPESERSVKLHLEYHVDEETGDMRIVNRAAEPGYDEAGGEASWVIAGLEKRLADAAADAARWREIALELVSGDLEVEGESDGTCWARWSDDDVTWTYGPNTDSPEAALRARKARVSDMNRFATTYQGADGKYAGYVDACDWAHAQAICDERGLGEVVEGVLYAVIGGAFTPEQADEMCQRFADENPEPPPAESFRDFTSPDRN
jgi:hypothetical protein